MKTTIKKTLVPENQRLGFLLQKLGKDCLLFEINVYAQMDWLCPEYKGGYWQFYNLSNGGFYMALEREEPLRVVFPNNYFDEPMSTDAASIAANLFALNGLCWKAGNAHLSDAYYALRDYGAAHKEGARIMRVID